MRPKARERERLHDSAGADMPVRLMIKISQQQLPDHERA
jgi:hypothetical protein